jgi:hypothetical protein
MDADHLEKERLQFEEEVRILGGGDPLAACALILDVWATMLPQQGSMAARCVLMAECIRKTL